MAISHVDHLIRLLILSLFLLPTLRAIHYSDCGDRDGPVDVLGVEEILKDKNKASFKISASTSKNITGGDIYVEVKLGLTPLVRRHFELCKLVTCPVAPGAFVLPLDNLFTSYPVVRFCRVSIDIFDNTEDINQIMCLTFEYQRRNSFVVSS